MVGPDTYVSDWHVYTDEGTTGKIYLPRASTTSSNYWVTSSTSNTYNVYYDWINNTLTNSVTCNDTSDIYYKKIRTTCLSDTEEQWVVYKQFDYTYDARPALSPADRLREIIRSRQAPLVIGSRTPAKVTADPKEIRARETLLRVLGEEKFRGFLRNGFVSVRGKSGKVYQIFPGHGMTKVYQNGQMIDRLCVVLQGDFPPTDSIIMRFLLILNDEAEFYRLAIKHGVIQSRPGKQRNVDVRSLPEIYRGLVAA